MAALQIGGIEDKIFLRQWQYNKISAVMNHEYWLGINAEVTDAFSPEELRWTRSDLDVLLIVARHFLNPEIKKNRLVRDAKPEVAQQMMIDVKLAAEEYGLDDIVNASNRGLALSHLVMANNHYIAGRSSEASEKYAHAENAFHEFAGSFDVEELPDYLSTHCFIIDIF